MKRMIEKKNGSWFINSSSLEVINTCKRKAKFILNDRLVHEQGESAALTFGSAIHKALEARYSNKDWSEESVLEAFNAAYPDSIAAPEGDKRSADNGRKILKNYLKVYANDPWVIYQDEQGPFVERSFELPFLFDGKPSNIHAFGQIDCILQNPETGEVVICDHKTTSTVSDLLNRVKPNHQFTLYYWAAQRLGIPVTGIMVNGIQVAKTKQDLFRIVTTRDADDIQEMGEAIMEAVSAYEKAQATDTWPMSTASCSHYGGCQYLNICSLAAAQRKTAIQAEFGV